VADASAKLSPPGPAPLMLHRDTGFDEDVTVLRLLLPLAALMAWTAAPLARSPVSPIAALREAVALPGQGETRAALVALDGKVAAEHYGPGYSAETRFVSWSMAKTVTALALGILHDEGKIDLNAPAPIPAWRTLTDGRETITTRHLLTMTSGLQHQESGERGLPIERADTVRMLFSDGAQDAAGYAIARPLAHPPGTHWQYSTATTHILSEIVTNIVAPGKPPAERRTLLAAWFKARLWDPLGVNTAEWDFDAKGLFLGGSMLHMTARDFAKLGQLMLDRGAAPDGRRIVSDAWIATMLTKAAAKNNNHYAGQLWLNTGPAEGQPHVLFHPKGDADAYAMIGHLGQYVVVAPSRRTVVVRLGKSVTAERPRVREILGTLLETVRN
jgi:CubicO group peptidase (beta-lactamase class C family)